MLRINYNICIFIRKYPYGKKQFNNFNRGVQIFTIPKDSNKEIDEFPRLRQN